MTAARLDGEGLEGGRYPDELAVDRWPPAEYDAEDELETPRAGLEPATCRLEGDCSFQLSYRGKIIEIIPQSRVAG